MLYILTFKGSLALVSSLHAILLSDFQQVLFWIINCLVKIYCCNSASLSYYLGLLMRSLRHRCFSSNCTSWHIRRQITVILCLFHSIYLPWECRDCTTWHRAPLCVWCGRHFWIQFDVNMLQIPMGLVQPAVWNDSVKRVTEALLYPWLYEGRLTDTEGGDHG